MVWPRLAQPFEHVPTSQQTKRIGILAVVELTKGLIAELFVPDVGVDPGDVRGLVDFDLALGDVELVIDDLQFRPAFQRQRDQFFDVDFAYGGTSEACLHLEGRSKG